jgi:hypothetical protein
MAKNCVGARFTDIVDTNNMRMMQLCGDARLVEQALYKVGV